RMHIQEGELISNSDQGTIDVLPNSMGSPDQKPLEDPWVKLLLEKLQEVFVSDRISVGRQRPQIVAGAAQHKSFKFPVAKWYIFQQRAEVLEGPSFQDHFSSLGRQILDGRKADPHGVSLDNAWGIGKVHVGRKQPHPLSREIGRHRPKRIKPAVVIENRASK